MGKLVGFGIGHQGAAALFDAGGVDGGKGEFSAEAVFFGVLVISCRHKSGRFIRTYRKTALSCHVDGAGEVKGLRGRESVLARNMHLLVQESA